MHELVDDHIGCGLNRDTPLDRQGGRHAPEPARVVCAQPCCDQRTRNVPEPGRAKFIVNAGQGFDLRHQTATEGPDDPPTDRGGGRAGDCCCVVHTAAQKARPGLEGLILVTAPPPRGFRYPARVGLLVFRLRPRLVTGTKWRAAHQRATAGPIRLDVAHVNAKSPPGRAGPPPAIGTLPADQDASQAARKPTARHPRALPRPAPPAPDPDASGVRLRFPKRAVDVPPRPATPSTSR